MQARAPNTDPPRRWSGWALVAGLLVGIPIGLLAGFVIFDDGESPPPVRPTTLQRITEDPRSFFGDPAQVSGQVREILSPRAFTVSPPGFLGPDLLVVTRARLAAPTGDAATRPILEGDSVQVAGEVRPFDVSAFERDVGAELRQEFDLFVGDDLSERKGDPAIQADEVVFLPRTTPVVEARAARDVAERPSDFYGTIVSVSGRVSEVLQSGVLVLDGDMLALTADLGERRPRKGDQIRIVGPVRPFDPDQFREGRLPDDEVLGGLANRPAVVAQSIEMAG